MPLKKLKVVLVSSLLFFATILAINTVSITPTNGINALTIINSRVNYLANFRWTPQESIAGWNSKYYLYKNGSYTIPYSQPYMTGGYIYYNVPIDEFENKISQIKSSTKHGAGQMMPGVGMDCSSFVSYLLDMPKRFTTYTFSQSANSNSYGLSNSSWSKIKSGDLLNSVKIGHVMYVINVNGNYITTVEQTPNNGIDTVIRTRTNAQLSGYNVISYNGKYISDLDYVGELPEETPSNAPSATTPPSTALPPSVESGVVTPDVPENENVSNNPNSNESITPPQIENENGGTGCNSSINASYNIVIVSILALIIIFGKKNQKKVQKWKNFYKLLLIGIDITIY